MSDEPTNPASVDPTTTSQANQSNPPSSAEQSEPDSCAKCAELEAAWRRAAADLANYRQQAEREKADFARFSSEKIMSKLIPVLENFARASQHIPPELVNSEYAKGMLAIQAQLEQALAGSGLEKIEPTTGSDLDPVRHEVIAMAAGAEGKVIAVLSPGWQLGTKVLQTAKVQVGTGESPVEATTADH